MKIRVRLTYASRSEWSQVVEVPDDATDLELDRLVEFWDGKIEGSQYTPDTDYCESNNYFEKLVDVAEPAVTYVRADSTGLFPELPPEVDEEDAANVVLRALRAHGLPTETDDTNVVFELDGRKFRLELTPEIAG